MTVVFVFVAGAVLGIVTRVALEARRARGRSTQYGINEGLPLIRLGWPDLWKLDD